MVSPKRGHFCYLHFLSLFSFYELCFYDHNIVQGSIPVLCLARSNRRYFIYDIESLYYFTKHCVILVEVRRTANGFVNFPLAGRNLSSFHSKRLQRIKTGISKNPSLCYIKLAAAAFFHWIYVITLSCRGDH